MADDQIAARACTGGFTWTLADMKAWLEDGLELNVPDRFPKQMAGTDSCHRAPDV